MSTSIGFYVASFNKSPHRLLRRTLLSLSLSWNKESNQRKFKEKSNTPHFFPCPRTSSITQVLLVILASCFLLRFFSLFIYASIQLLRLLIEHTVGATSRLHTVTWELSIIDVGTNVLDHSKFISTIFFYPFGVHFSIEAAFAIHWFNPLGIGCLTETIHIALHYDQLKVFEGVQLITADFGLVMVQGKKSSASKSAAVFFAPFFWANKRKEEGCTSKERKYIVTSLYALSKREQTKNPCRQQRFLSSRHYLAGRLYWLKKFIFPSFIPFISW